MKRRIVLNLYCFPVDKYTDTFDDHHDIYHQCYTRCQDDTQSQDEYPVIILFITLLLT